MQDFDGWLQIGRRSSYLDLGEEILVSSQFPKADESNGLSYGGVTADHPWYWLIVDNNRLSDADQAFKLVAARSWIWGDHPRNVPEDYRISRA
jgi:hypothetical protein